jgi:GT2 family glycosyltransferase
MTHSRTAKRRFGTGALTRVVGTTRSFVARRKHIARLLQRLLDRFPALQEAVVDLLQGDPQERYERWISEYDTIDDFDLSAMRDERSQSADGPLFAIIVPIADTTEAMVEDLARSLLSQVYEHWQVDFVGEPLDEVVTSFIAQAPSLDARFRPPSERAEPLADAWNHALRSAASEFIVFVDPHVGLRPHSLFLLASTLEHQPEALVIYADEDVIDGRGARSRHYFKPDWNEALLRSQNYFGGFVFFRRSQALAVGGCHEELDDDCVWGLLLRVTAGMEPGAIHHIPFILSHRRVRRPSTEPNYEARRQRVARALERRLALIGEYVHVEPVGEASFGTRYVLPKEPPRVSVIVPTTCELELLRPCLEGLLNRTSYPHVEILLVVNGIRKIAPEQREYLEAVAAGPNVRALFHDEPQYNFSRMNNWAAEQARGELLCFLNDDTEVIGAGWLAGMASVILQDRVGAVGAMLLYPSERIQHAGVVLGPGGVAALAYRGTQSGRFGYHDRALIDQDVSCVTAACMLVRREVFSNIGGFDPALAIAYNDVDFCLRLREAGWRIVWTPSAELYHKESASLGRHDTGDTHDQWMFEWNLIRSRWDAELFSDPHYNPNLSLDALQLWEPAFPPRLFYPWRAGSREGGDLLEGRVGS